MNFGFLATRSDPKEERIETRDLSLMGGDQIVKMKDLTPDRHVPAAQGHAAFLAALNGIYGQVMSTAEFIGTSEE
jgi:hypothetical protein